MYYLITIIIRGYTRSSERIPTWHHGQFEAATSFFAKHPDIEGYPGIAGLFRDTAEGRLN
jgi:hypothetical protein